MGAWCNQTTATLVLGADSQLSLIRVSGQDKSSIRGLEGVSSSKSFGNSGLNFLQILGARDPLDQTLGSGERADQTSAVTRYSLLQNMDRLRTSNVQKRNTFSLHVASFVLYIDIHLYITRLFIANALALITVTSFYVILVGQLRKMQSYQRFAVSLIDVFHYAVRE